MRALGSPSPVLGFFKPKSPVLSPRLRFRALDLAEVF